jgi:hypothetical protein
MTAQTLESKHVLRAHVFVVRFASGEHYEAGCIAESRSEALEIIKHSYAGFPDASTMIFFGVAQAMMQPAIIQWWSRDARSRDVRYEEKGYYAFLNGIFFCQCGDHQVATHCKQEETRTGWIAVIYGCNHDVRPL